MSAYTDQDMLRKVQHLLENIDQNQQVQQAAYENGIDVKNSTRLTAATKDNLAVSVLALLLAKRNNDPRCKDLVDFGLKHRTTKVDIINDYKAEANALITRYRNGERPEPEEIQVSISTESYFDEDIPFDSELYTESYLIAQLDSAIQESSDVGGKVAGVLAGAVAVAIALPFILIAKAINIIVRLMESFVNLFTRSNPDKLLKKLKKMSPEKKNKFTFVLDGVDPTILKAETDTFMDVIDDIKALAEQCEQALETDKSGKTIRKAAQELMNKISTLPAMREIVHEKGEYYLNYDRTIDVMTDLARLNIRDVKDQAKKLKSISKRFETISEQKKAEQAKETPGQVGLSDRDIKELQRSLQDGTRFIQDWLRARDRIIRKADITYDTLSRDVTNASNAVRAKEEKRNLEDKQLLEDL